MALNFEKPRYSDRIGQTVQTAFMGIDLRKAACDGAICWMKNMCGDEYPLASVRKRRKNICAFSDKIYGLYAHDTLICAVGTKLKKLKDGTWSDICDIEASEKQFATLGDYLIILPDKKYFRYSTEEFGELEATWNGTASFEDGTYAGEEAEGCRIVTSDTKFPFKVGDAVTIEGAANESNNQTIIIREISDDGKSLGFYENSFITATGESLTLTRTVPDMDYICENENRLWGCKGNTIFASKLGDPFNWNVFDGLASDSYALDIGSSGDFTACFSYLGYPIFFKEDHIYKMYGSKPSNYQLMSSATLGVMKGAHGSLAVAGEILYYLSKAGVMAYSGGIPQNISERLRDRHYSNAVAGSDGTKYYISVLDNSAEKYELLCYDTTAKEWYREDEVNARGIACLDGLNIITEDGKLFEVDSKEPNEEVILSELEFADFIEESPNKKTTSKLLIRVELEEDAELSVKMSFDSVNYILVKTLTASGKRSYYLPILVRRCDRFRVKFEGKGTWRLYSLTREFSEGSSM